MAISSCFRYHLLKNSYSKRKPKPINSGLNGFPSVLGSVNIRNKRKKKKKAGIQFIISFTFI